MTEAMAMYDEKARILADYAAHVSPQTIITGRCWHGRVLHVWQEWSGQPAICGSHVYPMRWSTESSYLCPQCLRAMRRALERARQAPRRE